MIARTSVTAYGMHPVRHALEKEAVGGTLLVQAGRADRRVRELVALAKARGLAVETVPREVLDKRVPGRHQGVALAGDTAPEMLPGQDLPGLLAELGEPALLLVLDGVEDPRNLGACLRSADAAGAHAVIVPRRRAAGLGPAARKVAAGAAEHLPVFTVANLARGLRELKAAGLSIVGTGGDAARSLYEADLTRPVAIVMGGEARGLRRLTREHCDEIVSLPMAGRVESLNVAVAAGICLYEAVRQRRAGA